MTLDHFIANQQLTFTLQPADSNPHMADMPRGSSHWKVAIRKGKRSLTVPFSQGPALIGQPTFAQVLEALASDAAGLENAGGNFNEWCRGYALDEDSRKAKRVFQAVEKYSARLERLLGEAAYEVLLRTVELE